MKKIFAASFLLLLLAACEKNETDLHCWECSYTKKVDNENGVITSSTESKDVCNLSEEEIRQYELRYRTRKELNVEYGDMTCKQKPSTPKK